MPCFWPPHVIRIDFHQARETVLTMEYLLYRSVTDSRCMDDGILGVKGRGARQKDWSRLLRLELGVTRRWDALYFRGAYACSHQLQL